MVGEKGIVSESGTNYVVIKHFMTPQITQTLLIYSGTNFHSFLIEHNLFV